MIKRLILMLKALRIYAVSGSLPTTSEIEQKCDFVAMKDGYDITGGGTVADFTDGFMKGALWMKRVVEFLKIINEKNQLGLFLPGEEKITIGSSISELKIGEVFSIWSGMTSFRRTSTVGEIITPNLFITSNSVYFLKDQKFFIQQNREEKLNQIIND